MNRNAVKNNDAFLIKGRRVRKDKAGNYQLSLERIRNEDLSAIPAGTVLVVRPEWNNKHLLDELVTVTKIEILGSDRVRVHGGHLMSIYGSEHAIDTIPYCDILTNIIDDAATRIPGFMKERGAAGKRQFLIRRFSIETRNGTFEEIRRALLDVAEPLIRPLAEFREFIDQEMKNRFGPFIL